MSKGELVHYGTQDYDIQIIALDRRSAFVAARRRAGATKANIRNIEELKKLERQASPNPRVKAK